jgi:hypothetical protein
MEGKEDDVGPIVAVEDTGGRTAGGGAAHPKRMTPSITYRRKKRPFPIETFLLEKTFEQWAGRHFFDSSSLPPG